MMSAPAFLIYLFQVTALSAGFYLIFRMFLRQETFHRLNRFVLIGIVLVSFMLPLCRITIRRTLPLQREAPTTSTMPSTSQMTVADDAEPESSRPMSLIFMLVFGAGATFVTFRNLISVLGILRLRSQAHCMKLESGIKVFVTEKDIQPFSWLDGIFLSREDYASSDPIIFKHEEEHLRLKHTFDLLLVDLLSAFQWFNPTFQLLRSDLDAIHEFEVDRRLLSEGIDPKVYHYLLVDRSIKGQKGRSGSFLAHSSLSRRIHMMQREATPSTKRWRSIFLGIPAIVFLLWTIQVRFIPSSAVLLPTTTIVQTRKTVHEPITISPDPVDRYLQFTPFHGTSPVFPNGNFQVWTASNLLKQSVEESDSGTIWSVFSVQKDGSLDDIHIVGICSTELKENLTRLLGESPKWKPAGRHGRPVCVTVVQPITIKIL